MKPFTTLAAVIFLVVTVGHLTRLLLRVEVSLNGWPLPMWISGLGTIVPAILSVMLFREARGARAEP